MKVGKITMLLSCGIIFSIPNMGFAKPVKCMYLYELYDLGEVLFLDKTNQPFYCTYVNGYGVWRNLKRSSDRPEDLEMDIYGNVYPIKQKPQRDKE